MRLLLGSMEREMRQPSVGCRSGQMAATNQSKEASSGSRGSGDLLIVGPGVLGGLVGKLYRDLDANSEIVGQTNTEANHER